jgi:hypothetical protein
MNSAVGFFKRKNGSVELFPAAARHFQGMEKRQRVEVLSMVTPPPS